MATTRDRTPNLKVGWCTRCRTNEHGICNDDDCTCSVRIHANRPGFGRAGPAGDGQPVNGQPAPVPRNGGGACPTARCAGIADRRHHGEGEGQEETVWALVKEEPPPKPKPTQADRARPLLEALVEADERGWYRIALFASAHAAGQVRRSLQKAYPAWEWKTARDSEGRPAAYVRWLGRAEP